VDAYRDPVPAAAPGEVPVPLNIAETTATSGAVLGLVLVLLAQQLGLFALADLWSSLAILIVGLVVGGLVFGALGYLVDRHR